MNWYTALSINEKIAYKLALSASCVPMNIAEVSKMCRNAFYPHEHKALVFMGYNIYRVPSLKCKNA